MGEDHDAKLCYERALTLEPENSNAWSGLGDEGAVAILAMLAGAFLALSAFAPAKAAFASAETAFAACKPAFASAEAAFGSGAKCRNIET